MRQWDAGEDILAYDGGSNKRLEKISVMKKVMTLTFRQIILGWQIRGDETDGLRESWYL